MKKTIFSKVFGGYVIVISMLTILILVFSSRTIRSHYMETLGENLKNLGLALEVKTIPFLDRGEFKELDLLIKKLGKETNRRITVVDPGGIVLADSEEDPESMESHKSRPEVAEALMGRTGKSIRYSATVKEEMLYVALPIEKNGKIMGVMRTSLFLREIDLLLGSLKEKILQIGIITALISLLVALFFSGTLTKPIKKLVEASRYLAAGNFDIKLSSGGTEEIKELVDSFNYMGSQIKSLFTKLSLQKEELAAIIESIQEGLAVLDVKGGIVLSNDAFRKISGNTDVSGRYIWEILRTPCLSDLIKRVTDSKRGATEEILLYEKSYLCSVVSLISGEELVVLLYDITDIRKLEKIKRDFVVNVSHELRTPLTAIKGFVETMEDDLDQKDKHYLHIVQRHTDRLIKIVEDLLLLSEIERDDVKLELEKINLKDFVHSTLKVYEKHLQKKGLDVKIDLGNVSVIKADPFRIEQVFINLIDNAIKYTEKGHIKISAKKADGSVSLEIEDTGTGIPSQHLSRIFERFYVVDKSRSRKMGGTGLGLSIVKHIVVLHGGSVNVESRLGSGTKFIINLPLPD